MNSLAIIAGPLATPLFGQRYGESAPEGGFAYETNRTGSDGLSDQFFPRLGVAFGLSPQLEAGALFFSFRVTPDFSYADFPVYLTYSWTFGPLDVGARFSMMTPIFDESTFTFNPGMPLLLRLGKGRIDAGVFVPLLTGEELSVGLNVPVRATYNITPRWFLGAESGVYEAGFGEGGGATSNLGISAGYTTFFGSRLVDLAARFHFDDLLHYAPVEGQDTVETSRYQIFFGATFYSKVM